MKISRSFEKLTCGSMQITLGAAIVFIRKDVDCVVFTNSAGAYRANPLPPGTNRYLSISVYGVVSQK